MNNELSNVQKNELSTGIYSDMRSAYKLGEIMSQAQVIPDAYKGKPADCMIAIDMANRMGVSPLMVMQSLYVVKGKPSWSGQACMSFIQANPNFKDVTPVYVGEPNTDSRGCYIQATRVSDGQIVKGTCVTMSMAKAEGWTRNQKWLTLTDLMLGYRASAFFARVYCPSILMGVSVEGEVEDITQTQDRKAVDVL
jgi:hypothetical protein